jgi:hypothetical protein
MSESTANMLYSAGISIATYGLWKTLQALYHRYYLRSECHERTLSIEIVPREPEPEEEQPPRPLPPAPAFGTSGPPPAVTQNEGATSKSLEPAHL